MHHRASTFQNFPGPLSGPRTPRRTCFALCARTFSAFFSYFFEASLTPLQNSPGTCLGTWQIGEQRKYGKGGLENGPAIWPKCNSLSIFCCRTTGGLRAETQSRAVELTHGPSCQSRKPNKNPFTRKLASCLLRYKLRKGSILFSLTGVGS